MRVTGDPSSLRAGTRTPRVLVPTMGALHEGHLALLQRAREAAGPDGEVAVSIFVNPIQFDRHEDLETYPRPLEDDLEQCRARGADLVFTPETTAMFQPDRSVSVVESSLSATLCGASRPGHFDGVCTIVLKLFNLLQPDAAVFGEKDYQQLAIIRRMVRDLDLPVEIIGHPTVRDPDGLALSSRNVRLTPEQRADAPRIRRALLAARDNRSPDRPEGLVALAREAIQSPLNRIDYLEAVDAGTLQPALHFDRPVLLAAAVFYGEVRLIDHILLPARP